MFSNSFATKFEEKMTEKSEYLTRIPVSSLISKACYGELDVPLATAVAPSKLATFIQQSG